MESENITTQVTSQESFIAPLRKVTPVSKYLALALFVILPFLGAWVGYTYAPRKVVEVEGVVVTNESNNQTAKQNVEPIYQVEPQEINDSVTTDWETYTNTELGFSIKHPSSIKPFIGNVSDGQTLVNFKMDAVMIFVDTNSSVEKRMFAAPVAEWSKCNVGGVVANCLSSKTIDGTRRSYVFARNDLVYSIVVFEKYIDDPDAFISSFEFLSSSTN